MSGEGKNIGALAEKSRRALAESPTGRLKEALRIWSEDARVLIGRWERDGNPVERNRAFNEFKISYPEDYKRYVAGELLRIRAYNSLEREFPEIYKLAMEVEGRRRELDAGLARDRRAYVEKVVAGERTAQIKYHCERFKG
jgi:hypothetical protein